MVTTFTFGEFELDLRAEVLTRSGARIRLASQPLKLLTLLVRRAGELVTREDIVEELWTKGAVVDFDHVVNQYIRQLRSALGDNRGSPVYIETAPRRGYRFIAAVNRIEAAHAAMTDRGEAQDVAPPSREAVVEDASVRVDATDTPRAPTAHRAAWIVAPLVIVTIVIASAIVLSRDRQTHSEPAVPHTPVSLASEARAGYEKGRYFFNQGTRASFQKACDYFQRALDADPSYALAYKGMADCYMALSSAGLATADEAMPKARAMARKAIALDDALAEGHIVLGVVYLNYDWNWPAARAELERATALAPSNIDAHFALSSYYRVVGQIDAGARELKWAQVLDPVSVKSYHSLGWLYVWAGRYQEASTELQKCVELAPDYTYAYFGLFMAYDHLGKEAQAMAALQRYLALQNEADIAARVAKIYSASGYTRARREYLELMVAANVQRHFLAYQIAGGYALLGDQEKALDYLEQAYRERSNHLTHLKVDSYFDSLRGEVRFQQLLRLTDEQLSAASIRSDAGASAAGG